MIITKRSIRQIPISLEKKQRLEKAAEQRLKADAKKQKAAPAPESEMNVNMLKTQIEKLNEIAAQLISEGKQLTQQQEKEMEKRGLIIMKLRTRCHLQKQEKRNQKNP